ncbi:MAG: hypothetical protein AABZ57_07040, partial [Candidatus Margulisiibacteriota bacterium]
MMITALFRKATKSIFSICFIAAVVFGIMAVPLVISNAVLASSAAAIEKAADPGGGVTGSAIDIPAANAGEPTMKEMADAIGHNKVSINFVWVLI